MAHEVADRSVGPRRGSSQNRGRDLPTLPAGNAAPLRLVVGGKASGLGSRVCVVPRPRLLGLVRHPRLLVQDRAVRRDALASAEAHAALADLQGEARLHRCLSSVLR